MSWSTSPACTELETHVLDWLVEMLGLPARFLSAGAGGGVIQDTASSAALCALLAARERATGGAATRRGNDPRLTAYASEHAHSSVEKAVRIAGLGSDRLRLVPAGAGHALDAARLGALMAADRQAGLVPFLVVATVGTTASLAVDPVPDIADACAEHGAWLHVDAAMAGTATLCPEHRGLHAGIERADSWCFNPHKWMFTNFDCDCFWVADRAALVRALSILPEYLRNAATESGKVIDYRDWQVPLGRRFRALKLWLVIRRFGVEGLRSRVRRHVQVAAALEGWIAEDPRFEIAAPRRLNLACFRLREGGDPANQALIDAVNATGRAFLTHCRLDGRLTVRLCVGQTRTEERHVREAWELLQREASRLAEKG
jgi:aromatic-L-amino-acid decarboxylase